MSQNNIIELNGKRYDALTGKLLGESRAPVAEPLAPAKKPTHLRSMDGIVLKPHLNLKKSDTSTAPAQIIAKPKPHPTPKTKRSATTVKPHQPEHAKTLMRRAVHKPKNQIKPAIKPQAPAEIMATPIKALTQKRSVQHIDPMRMHRAGQVPKHRHVTHFTQAAAQGQLTAITVRPQVAAHAVAPIPHHSSQVSHHQKQSKQMFEDAIARSNSHEQPPHKVQKHHKKQSRLAGTLAGIAAFLMLGGFLAYLNMPRIELKVASFQAGFNAQLPQYSPTGYKLADIENRHGVISLSFRSGESRYNISQQPSSWNSQTLKDDLIATADHEAIENKGRIIYVHNGNASWVNGGVRYDLTSNAHLSKDDIVDIATSM